MASQIFHRTPFLFCGSVLWALEQGCVTGVLIHSLCQCSCLSQGWPRCSQGWGKCCTAGMRIYVSSKICYKGRRQHFFVGEAWERANPCLSKHRTLFCSLTRVQIGTPSWWLRPTGWIPTR